MLLFYFLAGNAAALPFGDNGAAMQAELDKITVSPVPGDSNVDAASDFLPDEKDSYWALTSINGTNTIVIENTNAMDMTSFGIFDKSDHGNKIELFSGGKGAGDYTYLSILDTGEVYVTDSLPIFPGSTTPDGNFSSSEFGFYLDSSAYTAGTGGGVFYSDTAYNSDAVDHMVAYQGNETDKIEVSPWAPFYWWDDVFILGFEDLTVGGDQDYTDFVVLVENVKNNPAPEPATMGLLGIGLIGIATGARRKMNTCPHAADSKPEDPRVGF